MPHEAQLIEPGSAVVCKFLIPCSIFLAPLYLLLKISSDFLNFEYILTLMMNTKTKDKIVKK